jgi:oligopeptidase B
VSTQSLVAPKRWWSVDLRTGQRSLLRATEPPGYQEADFHTERLYAPAPDGETIPVTVACRTGRQPGAPGGTGGAVPDAGPCLVGVYGAYEACRDPRFSVGTASLLERGFVYAIAHVRGGGERGRRWWLDGRLGAKRNTFTDFRAVRDHLVAGSWAAPGRVAARGLSAGGLTVAVAYTWWPAAWAAMVAEAPAVDLLNVMLDPAAPLTVNEYDEWGDPADPRQFGWMRSYTPYENVPSGVPGTGRRRPPLLVTGMLRDPRVAVHEPAKWVAALRAAGVPPGRLLFRADLASGAHRGPSGRTGSLAYEAEVLAWVISTVLSV